MGYETEVLVVGAGPAGLAAAVSAAECGMQTTLLDDNPTAGGQIWRSQRAEPPPAAKAWIQRAVAAGVDVRTGETIVGATPSGELLAATNTVTNTLRAESTILATGARERFLPFPGWTVPGVFGLGGLQALVKGGFDVTGFKIAVCGTGPLLLQVAAFLKEHGAQVIVVAEQVGFARAARFAASLWRQPGKLKQLFALLRTLKATRRWFSTWPLQVEGDSKVERIVLLRRGRRHGFDCDLVACGFGLVPDTSLPAALGCAVDDDKVVVDRYQRTTVTGVLCAGEPTGVAGVDAAIVEGQIAGFTASERLDLAKPLLDRRDREVSFGLRLERAFAPRKELRQLPEDDTIVCRCEDVGWRAIRHAAGSRDAKLKTRCGMGPCQGRVCAPALDFLLGWKAPPPRPPLFPVPMQALAALGEEASK